MNDIRNLWWLRWCAMTIATPFIVLYLRFKLDAFGIFSLVLGVCSPYIVPVVCALGMIFKVYPPDSAVLHRPAGRKITLLSFWFFSCWILAGLILGSAIVLGYTTDQEDLISPIKRLLGDFSFEDFWLLTRVIAFSSVIPYFWLALYLRKLRNTTPTEITNTSDPTLPSGNGNQAQKDYT